VFGDAARLKALMAAGLARASAVVVTYLELAGAVKVLGHVRAHAPHVPVIVRTQDDHNLETLQQAGATEVVPEAIEGSLMLASHALALVGVPMRRVIRIVQDQREARYNLLRGFFHGSDDNSVDELQHVRLATLTLPAQSRSSGALLGQFGLDGIGVNVLSLRRNDGKTIVAPGDTPLQGGDILVLSGKAENLTIAEQTLLRGLPASAPSKGTQ
jgi:CPA2 family monovalent cation:H+ antiporter-2